MAKAGQSTAAASRLDLTPLRTCCPAPQGACALPDGQFRCFLPSKLKRTCDVQEVNLTTGLGCAEKGRDVFATQETCCTRLLDTSEQRGG